MDCKVCGREAHVQDMCEICFNSMFTTAKIISNPNRYYVVDWDKVKSIEDLITILKGLNLSFNETYEKFNEIKHLLKTEDNNNG